MLARCALAGMLAAWGCAAPNDAWSGLDGAEPSPSSPSSSAGAETSPSAGSSSDASLDESATASPSDSGGGTSSSTGSGDGPSHGEPASDFPELGALLEEIEGWATGTTGGLDGTVFVVDTLADDGPRSLRAALTSAEPHWILFAPGLDGTIDLADTIQPASDKTVDARGHAIRIRTSGGDPFTAFVIESQSNLVFVDLTLDDELENWDQDSEGADGMTIRNSHHIWIHHCSFARWLDGAIDIRHDPAVPGELSHHISVTWSSFSRVYQALNWTADRISFGHNHCDRVRRRCIQMIDGKGHSYDNVIADWNDAAIQNSKDGAQILSQLNMFVSGADPGVDSRVNGGKIRNLDNHAFGSVQFLGGNDALDETFESESMASARLDSCDANDDACWNELRALVEDLAGAHP